MLQKIFSKIINLGSYLLNRFTAFANNCSCSFSWNENSQFEFSLCKRLIVAVCSVSFITRHPVLIHIKLPFHFLKYEIFRLNLYFRKTNFRNEKVNGVQFCGFWLYLQKSGCVYLYEESLFDTEKLIHSEMYYFVIYRILLLRETIMVSIS